MGRVKHLKVKPLDLDDRHIERFFQLAPGYSATCFVCLIGLARTLGVMNDGAARAVREALAKMDKIMEATPLGVMQEP